MHVMRFSRLIFLIFLVNVLLYIIWNKRFITKLPDTEPKSAFSVGVKPSELLIGDTTTFYTSDKSRDFQNEFFKNFPVEQYSAKSSRRGLPELIDIKFSNKFWQILSISTKTIPIYLLSAFYDNRVGPPVIRIVVGLHEEVHENEIVNCHIWFSDLDEPKIVPAIIDNSFVEFPKPLWHFPTMITCPLDINSTIRIPKLVSLASKNSKDISNLLKVTYNPGKNGTRHRLALCVKRIFEPSRENILPLIEWFETQLALGVSKIFMYVMHAHTNYIKVLDYYWQKGVLEVTPVTYPGNVMASEPYIFKLQRDSSLLVKWYSDQFDYHDCLLRNMHNYDFISFLDTDEVLTPEKKAVTLIKLLDELESKLKISTEYDAISFQNIYYDSPVSQNLPPKGNFIVDNQSRSTTTLPKDFKSKVLFNTRTVIEAHNHWVNKCFDKACKTFYVPPEIGSSHHYRYRVPSKTEFNSSVPLPWFNQRVKETSRATNKEILKLL